ncbi:hypothetical protein HJC23_011508 [Cyclotella cryptica]|uniref:DAGKc domain-containing protein n=1 Tax=Cyclotella cryptica TaxID=29204 RepID=A0ABD3PUM7_9STRA|eukprot:CCRYP_011306-RA/>CCRYP_011306-RA protein AED:0.12 eAED:-0.01 QI:0/-1/0/1/-1/1/1/0/596
MGVSTLVGLLMAASLRSMDFREGPFCTAYTVAATNTHARPVSNGRLVDDHPSIDAISSRSTAAILNTNARSVSAPLISLAREVLGEANVHVTSSAEEARLAARCVIRGNYSLVVPMGGDGTLSGWIDDMVQELMEYRPQGSCTVEEAMRRLPVVGYVPRGTGNGLGHVVGCWRLDHATASSEPEHGGSSENKFLSRINLFSWRTRRRRDKTRTVLLRLKEVGDILQKLRNATNDSSSLSLQQAQHSKLDLENALWEKCSIVEMPMMQVIHHSHDDNNNEHVSSLSTFNATNIKGDLCFFAGSGFDSLMLHDFQQVKAWSSTSKTLPTFLRSALSSVAGYCVALLTLTLPQTLRYGTHRIHVRVTTQDEDTLWVDHRRGDFSELAVSSRARMTTTNTENVIANGVSDDTKAMTELNRSSQPQKKQHLLYSGTTGILAASTTPFYGGGLRLFPYARLIPGKLQLRLGRISPLVGFFNIPKIFEGSYREKSDRFGCLDFIGQDFEVEVSSDKYEEHLSRKRRRGSSRWWWWRTKKAADGSRAGKEDGEANGEEGVSISKGFPFQHSGESMGIKERFRLRIVKQPVKFVSFLRPRVIVDE